MANPHRGEVGFEAAGRRWTFRFTANAIVELEDAVDLGISEIAERLQKSPRIKLVRTVFWAGLIEHQPEATEKQAGALMSEIGMPEAMKLIGEGFRRALPESEGEDGDTARPPEAASETAGTGASS